jgi:hypothetical protein
MIMRSDVPPELRALLDKERFIPPLSASQRARAMARARAALAAPVTATAAPVSVAPRLRWAAAAAAGLLVSGAVAAAAYEIHARLARADMTPPAAVVSVSNLVASAPSSSAPSVAALDLRPASPATVGTSGPSTADLAREELHLMRQARATVARGDFEAALSAIAEHARRFKNGRLVEEREALRVKALVGLGRAEEARHAAAAFRARFPLSVLLPAVGQMPVSRP